MIERVVTADQAGQRVDKFLRKLLAAVPQSHIYRLLRLRRVRVNGTRAKESTLLAEGDRIVIRGDEEKLMAPAPAGATPHKGSSLVVLFEDAHLLAVDKPAGLAVHPGSGIEGSTLVDIARAYVGPAEAGGFSASPAHRLDRETSGVVLVAKTRRAMVRLTELFTAGEVAKRYLVLAKGRFSDARGTIDLALAEHEQTAKSREQHGVKLQEAVTHYERLAATEEVTLLACRIETGRNHQIRRHLAAIGHPVVGDKKHGDFAFNRRLRSSAGLKRMFLHAQQLSLRHPISNEPLMLVAQVPRELRLVLQTLAIDPEGPTAV